MVPQTSVEAVEEVIPHHEGLTDQGLLGRATEAFDSACEMSRLHCRLYGECGAERSGCIGTMTTAMPGAAYYYGLSP